jgi:AcrR family transcriptional regulator
VEAAASGGVPRASRLDRRKARTRQALIDAAVRLIAEGRGERASIAEIPEEADIGFGSFYNHFDSKEQLFGTVSGELLEQWGQVIDRACADISDPAEVFAVSLRISGRLGWAHRHHLKVNLRPSTRWTGMLAPHGSRWSRFLPSEHPAATDTSCWHWHAICGMSVHCWCWPGLRIHAIRPGRSLPVYRY